MKRPFLMLLVLTGAAIFTLAYAERGKADFGVYARDSVVFGRTYGEWSAAWQQWADSIPALEHPLLDNADCSKGQSGPVWFLGGKFCSAGDPSCPFGFAVRSCRVPTGKALYFPVVDFGCLNAEAKHGLCGNAGPFITQMRASIGDAIDQTINLQVTVDGKPIVGDLKNNFRVQSIVYSAELPDHNLLQEIGEPISPGPYWGVDAGLFNAPG